HQVELVGVDAGLVAEDEQDDGQAHADLDGGHEDHEQGEDLAHHRVAEGAEGDQVDVDGVEHQLDRHQHQHRVAAGEDAVYADAEQHRGEKQELVQVHRLNLSGRG